MRNYSQESSRGERDGKQSEAIVVMPAGKQEELQKKIARVQVWTQPWKIRSRVMRPWEAKQMGWEKMDKFLGGGKCRRIYLDSEMDDRHDQIRCEEGEEQCDVCEKDDAMSKDMEAQQAAYIEEEREMQEQANQYEREKQDQWLDSGIDVPSSSIGIPPPSSDINRPSSPVNASPHSSTVRNATSR